ncbi:hypothetical protein R1flu_015455 [Riccia fluitans]|uniref:Uncharacterized protein n=1 Tax=Riccia fluitans TaxID=41844 RepID=A0ABD1YJ07_9MARC
MEEVLRRREREVDKVLDEEGLDFLEFSEEGGRDLEEEGEEVEEEINQPRGGWSLKRAGRRVGKGAG